MAEGTFEAAGDVSLILLIRPNESITVVLTEDAEEAWSIVLEEVLSGGAYRTVATHTADTAGAVVTNDSPRAKHYRLRVVTLVEGDTVDYELTSGAASGPESLDTSDEQAAAIAALQADVAALQAAVALLAPLASPAFTGNPTATTQSPGNDSTRIATTAFVTAAIAAIP